MSMDHLIKQAEQIFDLPREGDRFSAVQEIYRRLCIVWSDGYGRGFETASGVFIRKFDRQPAQVNETQADYDAAIADQEWTVTNENHARKGWG